MAQDLDLHRGLGVALRLERVRRGWTIGDLADASGLDRGYVGTVEAGRRALSLTTLAKLARGLGLAASELLAAAEREAGRIQSEGGER